MSPNSKDAAAAGIRRRKLFLIRARFCYGPFVKPTALPAEYGFTEWFRELVATALCNKFSCKEDQFFGKTNAPKTNIKNAPTASQ